MTAQRSPFFIGGWGTTDEVWQRTLNETHTQAPGIQPRLLPWLDCVQDWPGVLRVLSEAPGRCLLVGWSLGSLLALRAALELPEKIAAMVLVSGTPCMCASEGYDGIDPRTLAAMQVRLARNPISVLEEFARRCTMPDGNDATYDGFLRQAMQFTPVDLAAGLECLATLDLRERLGELAVPCRILHGDCDRIVPLRSAEFLAARLPLSELEVLEARGHALPFTAPAEIARCIASVLA